MVAAAVNQSKSINDRLVMRRDGQARCVCGGREELRTVLPVVPGPRFSLVVLVSQPSELKNRKKLKIGRDVCAAEAIDTDTQGPAATRELPI